MEQHDAAACAAASVAATSSSLQQQQEHYGSLYESLLELGFTPDQVQDVLAALHGGAGGAGGLEACLDWLCLHVPPAQLPRRFTGSAAAQVAAGSAGVKVRAPCVC